ncbi:MAG TPA: CinA family protein [Chloroflexota bacterium]|nr:CinA family protein [Chloroflexota bacterium]
MSGETLAGELVQAAAARRLTLAIAEADTGGLVLSWLTAWPGSSAVVLGGVVPYADSLKRDLLGVDAELIAEHGAVSEAVAEAMAVGLRSATGADLALATTGIAGPGGARAGKPVGLAWVAVATAHGVTARQHRWRGDRAANRRASGRALLRLALEMVSSLEQMC